MLVPQTLATQGHLNDDDGQIMVQKDKWMYTNFSRPNCNEYCKYLTNCPSNTVSIRPLRLCFLLMGGLNLDSWVSEEAINCEYIVWILRFWKRSKVKQTLQMLSGMVFYTPVRLIHLSISKCKFCNREKPKSTYSTDLSEC